RRAVVLRLLANEARGDARLSRQRGREGYAAELETGKRVGPFGDERFQRACDGEQELGVRLEQILVEVLAAEHTGPKDELAGEVRHVVDPAGEGVRVAHVRHPAMVSRGARR